ncbi:MAG TPA: hypothetical protein VN605_02850 [Thermoanaerobaculia bacterium]|nr:hypothetical protein [Thermoanaerobaculia bacterium]
MTELRGKQKRDVPLGTARREEIRRAFREGRWSFGAPFSMMPPGLQEFPIRVRFAGSWTVMFTYRACGPRSKRRDVT